MKTNQQTCSAGKWNVSTCSSDGSGLLGLMKSLEAIIHEERPCVTTISVSRPIRGRTIRGQLNNVVVASQAEANKLLRLYGYTGFYCRNSIKFVMSRAARKHGYKTTERSYLTKVWYHGQLRNKAEIKKIKAQLKVLRARIREVKAKIKEARAKEAERKRMKKTTDG